MCILIYNLKDTIFEEQMSKSHSEFSNISLKSHSEFSKISLKSHSEFSKGGINCVFKKKNRCHFR